jgi:hypothetical protein
MELDRRQVLLTAAMTLATGRARARTERPEAKLPECHQLTRSLIERAKRASTATDRVDTDAIERIIRRMAEASGGPPVIKWTPSPTEAFDHLRKLDSSELGTSLAALWRVGRSCPPRSEDAFERSFRVRELASEILRPDEHDRTLMAPKERYLRSQACRCISGGAATGESRLLRDGLAGNVSAGCRDRGHLRDRGAAGIGRAARFRCHPRSGEGLRSLRAGPVSHVGDADRSHLRPPTLCRVGLKPG